MAYFPFFADIEGTCWLIAGGGGVALQKVQDLLPYGAAIKVVSPLMTDRLLEMDQSGAYRDVLTVIQRAFEDRDLEGTDFAIAATSEPSLNSHISALCRAQGIPVNVVDMKEECSFIFPSIVRDGPVVVGISTGGASPAIARYLKARVREALPEGLGNLAARLGEYRQPVKDLFPHSPAIRSSIFYEMAGKGLEQGCRLTDTQARAIIQRKLEQENES